MTTPTTGPLSLSALQTEFGGTNPISVSEYYAGGANVPAGTSGSSGLIPSSGQLSIRAFYNSADVVVLNTTPWMVLLTYSPGGANFISANIDTSGNAYLYGSGQAGTTVDGTYLLKINNNGTMQWQRKLYSAVADDAFDACTDSAGNSFTICRTGSTLFEMSIAKYNSAGVIQWQRKVYSATLSLLGGGIALDSTGNVYVCGFQRSSSGGASDDVFILKLDSSGTLQWQRMLSTALADNGIGIAADSSGNCYVGIYNNNGTDYDNIIAKYDTSGVIQWQRKLTGLSNDFIGFLKVDTSGNLYVVSTTYESGNANIYTIKYNTSGTLLWQRRLVGTGADQPANLSLDSSGNVYVVGSSNSRLSTQYDGIIAKYNTSGVLQWKNRIQSATLASPVTHAKFTTVAIDSAGNMIVTGYRFVGVSDMFVMKLPGDGTGQGVYGPLTYYAGATTLTESAGTATSSTSTLTDAAGILLVGAASLTDAALTTTTTTFYNKV